jgi:membrane complex biogenesis BtpA family protein
MIHLPPLPGAPNADGRPVAEITEIACEDARRLEEGGIDAILLQNANDHPPRKTIPPPAVAAYAVVAAAVRRVISVPLGISVLKSDPAASFAIAVASEAGFVRLKSYVGVEIGAEGLVEGCAADAVRIRRELGATGRIEIWADAIQPTSRPLGDVPVAELVVWCVAFGEADRVVITGASLTDSLAIIAEARKEVSVPLILGGGIDPATARRALAAADGLIVGRYLRGQSLTESVDVARVRQFVNAARGRQDTTPTSIAGDTAG